MAEDRVKKTKYKYDLNSNLVLQRSEGLSREQEPSGEGESLAGKKLAPFGSNVQREKPPTAQKQMESKKNTKQGQDQQQKQALKKKKNEVVDSKKLTKFNVNQQQTILGMDIEEDLVYRPKTHETRAVYDQILNIVARNMGDSPQDVIKGAVDEILAVLKNYNYNDSQRKHEIEAMIDKLSDEQFNDLTVLAQQIIDYDPEAEYRGEGEDILEANVEFDDDMEDDDDDPREIGIAGEEDEEDFDVAAGGALDKGDNVPQYQDADDNVEGGDGPSYSTSSKAITQHQKTGKDQIDASKIDAHWLKRTLGEHFDSNMMPEELLEIEHKIMEILDLDNSRECEKKLISLLSHDKFKLVGLLVKNRYTIYYGIKYQQAQSKAERDDLIKQMESHKEGRVILDVLQGNSTAQTTINTSRALGGADRNYQGDSLLNEAASITQKYHQLSSDEVSQLLQKPSVSAEVLGSKAQKQNVLDLDAIVVNQQAKLMLNRKVTLPKGSQKIDKVGYTEVFIPAQRHPNKDEKLIPITELPEWARPAFPPPIEKLNTIQSRLYKAAFTSAENLLVCAPTGAGKTNIALLSILQVLETKRKTNGKFDLRNFKIVYIAPMKALVTEIVGNFQKRLDAFGLTVRELTGDVHLTKTQIDETQVIVTTPEKWDIITRKSGDRAYIDLVKLIIIDEIHLLHDTRGPVLESIVARTIRQIEITSELVRIVGLSATLPNYTDVANFLRVKIETGLFFFDNTYRPVPLEQIYAGITEKKALKANILMNEICYEKVLERAGKHQILIFVHSRKETARTAKIIRDMALARDELHRFLSDDSMSKEILQTESETSKSQDIKDLLPYGLGIHHAGLAREDRLLVEQLFAAGHLQVLISTATLAWGVNLPAHTVIIKGTQIYSPEQGKWIELSPQDMLQMMGRAGRPQFDKLGEGIIITKFSEMQYYLSLNNQQLPIESQLITQLADQLNAEVVLGTISNTKEAVNWLSYTYLYVRMLLSPSVYDISPDEIAQDRTLIQRRADLVHTAAMILSKANMIKYERRTGTLQPTAIGKIASHYYIKHSSMSVYNDNLRPYMNIIDVFRLFALSKEFQFIPVRDNEKLELQKFIDKVPIPVKGSLDEPASKINILLQAYISKFKLEGYDLNADLVYVTQSAGRILRALLEICVKRGWAQLSEILLGLCKMAERRQWSSMTPLRQYHGIPEDILRAIEKKEQFTWQHFYDMSAQQIGEIVKDGKMGKVIYRLVHQFPRLQLEAYVQPLTRTIIRVELAINPDFQWLPKIHGRAEPFQIFVTDGDQEQILHHESFILKDKAVDQQHLVTFTVPLYEPMPPQYFIKVISDRWLQSETVLPVSFKHLILPERFAPPMELQDMHSRLVKELNFKEAENMYLNEDKMKEFNAIHTQAFNKLYQSDESIFIGTPSGGSQANTISSELALLRYFQKDEFGKAVYIAPVESLCKIRYQYWKQRLDDHFDLNVVMLTGVLANDLDLIKKGQLIIATPEKWDFMSRKWKQRKIVQTVGLYIFDEIHLLSESGSVYEVICSRVRYMQNELQSAASDDKSKIRIVALSTSLANAKDVANWLGISFPSNTFNFHPSVRPVPLEIHIQGYDHNNKSTRVLSMQRPAYNAIKKSIKSGKGATQDAQAIVFVSDRKQVRLTALDFTTFAASDDDPRQFLGLRPGSKEEQSFLQKNSNVISEETMQETLANGIAYLHDGLNDSEIAYIKQLFKQNIIKVLVVTQALCWEIGDLESHVVVIIDAEKFDGVENRYVEYSIPDMLQMMGRANQTLSQSRGGGAGPSIAAKCLLYCHTPRKEYFMKFLQEPLPIESHLDHFLHDHINSDIVAGTIENKQDAMDWITWTFMYRRISQNPNYYNLAGKTGQHINDHLSELIETTIEELEKARLINVKEDEYELEPSNFGKIAAFYYIKYQTIETFTKNLEDEGTANKKMRQLLEIIALAAEFESVPIRKGDDQLLRSLTSYLNYPIEASVAQESGQSAVKYNTPNNKANFLLQCHYNRAPLNIDLGIDQKFVLEKTLRLIQAMVDVISSFGHLQPALLCMEMSQMTVQAMWAHQSPLLQLPYFDLDVVSLLNKNAQVEDIADFMNMDDDVRQKLLNFSQDQMVELAAVCNRYPNLDIKISTEKDTYAEGDIAELIVQIQRSNVEDDEEELSVFAKPVYAQFYPAEKEEQWWVVVGQPKIKKLWSIKKVSNFKAQRQTEVKLGFVVNKNDSKQLQQEYKVYIICDSYVGCDQEETFLLNITEKNN